MSSIVDKIYSEIRLGTLVSHLKSALCTGGVNYLARSVTHTAFLPAVGFGLIALAVSTAVSPSFDRLTSNRFLNVILSGAVGGLAGYGAFLGAASFGVIAAPISGPTAAILTVVAIAMTLLKLEGSVTYCGSGLSMHNNKISLA